MDELRLIWLHPTGWTLTVLGATLFLLTLAAGPPPEARRKFLVWFGAIAVVGLICLGIYFGVNRGVQSFDVEPTGIGGG